jgi:hypothetical protein
MSDNYICNLCGRRGDALPTLEHSGDEPGFSLYDQPVVCTDCAPRWTHSTREYRRRVRQWLGTEPVEGEEVEAA